MYWFTTIRSYYQKNLFKVEIQNDAYPKYSLITRGDAYLSRIQTTHWGKEHDGQNYDGMEKVYLIWILPQAAKKRDGQVSICKIDEKKHLEKEYLNKGIWIGVEKGTQNERIKNIRKLMIKLKMTFKEAIQFLDILKDEVKEIEKYFKS